MAKRVLSPQEERMLATLHTAAIKNGKRGNINALQHGVYAARLFGEAERVAFESYRLVYMTTYGVDEALAELAALFLIQVYRAVRLQRSEDVEVLDRRWRRKLCQMRAYAQACRRQHAEHLSGDSLAVWAATLLSRRAQATMPSRRAATTKGD